MQYTKAIMKIQLLLTILFISVLYSSCDRTTKSDKAGEVVTIDKDGNPIKIDPILLELNKKIADHPEDYNSYLDRAKYYGERSKYDLAFQDISRAIATDSTKADIYLYKGELYFQQEKVQESYDEYVICIKYDSLNASCLLKKAGIDIVLKNYDVARNHINTVLRNNEYNAEAYYTRGRMYKMMGDSTLAASSYKTAIEVDPSYYDAYVEVGLLYAAEKNDLAKEYYNSAIAVRPRSVEAWYNKAMFLQETGFRKNERYKEAFVCYDSILKIDPGFVAANFNKGYIWLEYLQQYDSAAYYFTESINRFPQYFQAYYNRGLSYESLNKFKEAEADYRQALQLQPTYNDAAVALNRVLKLK